MTAQEINPNGEEIISKVGAHIDLYAELHGVANWAIEEKNVPLGEVVAALSHLIVDLSIREIRETAQEEAKKGIKE